MAIELCGTNGDVHSTDGSGSGSNDNTWSITIPTDCISGNDGAIILIVGFYNNSAIDFNQLNWDGDNDVVDFTKIGGSGYANDCNQVLVYYMLASDANWPGTGSKTLYYGWDNAISNGPWLSVIHIKNVNGTGTIIGTDTVQGGGSTNSWTSASLGTVDSGDMAFIAGSFWDNGTAGTVSYGSGQTEIANRQDNEDTTTGWAYEDGEATPSIQGTTTDEYLGAVAFAIAAVSGQSYTLTADAGSYALTGAAVDLLKDYHIDVDAGAYALTGTNIDLLLDRLLSIDAGSYAVAGTDASLLYGRTLIIEVGSYETTGAAISLLADRILSMDAGAYAVTGSDVNLTFGFILSADGGSYALSGTAASLLHDRLISVESGAYVLTGQDVTLTYTQGAVMSCDAGSYLITGSDANLIHDKLISIDPGSYLVTGTDASLLYDRLLSLDPGSYEIVGVAADLLRNYLIAIGVGSYALAGQDISFDYSGFELPVGFFTINFVTSKPSIDFSTGKPTIKFD